MNDISAPENGSRTGLSWVCRSEVRCWDEDVALWAAARWKRDNGWAENSEIEPFISEAYLQSILHIAPHEIIAGPVPGNSAQNVGLNVMTGRLTQPESNYPQWSPSSGGSGRTGIGVGDSLTGDSAGDGNILGTNKSFRVCDDTFPTHSNGTLVFKASFQNTEANFTWNEYGIIVPDSGSSSLTGAAVTAKPNLYVMLNHKAPAIQTPKTSGISAITITITIAGS